MIPSVLASQLQRRVADFLRTTLPIATLHFHGLLDRLLDETSAVFKGSYLSIALPFQPDVGDRDYFSNVPLEFPPHRHQEQAFGPGQRSGPTFGRNHPGESETAWPGLRRTLRRAKRARFCHRHGARLHFVSYKDTQRLNPPDILLTY